MSKVSISLRNYSSRGNVVTYRLNDEKLELYFYDEEIHLSFTDDEANATILRGDNSIFSEIRGLFIRTINNIATPRSLRTNFNYLNITGNKFVLGSEVYMTTYSVNGYVGRTDVISANKELWAVALKDALRIKEGSEQESLEMFASPETVIPFIQKPVEIHSFSEIMGKSRL